MVTARTTRRKQITAPPTPATGSTTAKRDEWIPPPAVELKEYLGSQLQYYFGLTPSQVRRLTQRMADIVEDGDATNRDKIEAMNALKEWKKLEMDAGLKVGDWLMERAERDSEVHQGQQAVSDEELAKGLRLLLGAEQQVVIEQQRIVEENETALHIEDVA